MSSGSSSSEDECLAVMAFAVAEKRRKYRMWVREAFKEKENGSYRMVRKLAMGDKQMYCRYMRMPPGQMEHLLSLVAPRIAKLSTNYREPIPPQHRLSVTLRHLATGESHISLSLQYRIGRQTISKIIPETCEAIYEVLAPVYVNTPTSSREWLAISKQSEERWNLPHVLGALDGKHIYGYEAPTILAPYTTIIRVSLAWCCWLSVILIIVSQCSIWASTGATTIVGCCSVVRWERSLGKKN